MIEVHGLGAATLARLIHSRRHTSEEVTQAYLRRIAQFDFRLKAYIEVFADEAIAEARAADAEIEAGKLRGPLHGVPIGIKDIMAIRGHAMTAGGKILSNTSAAEDSEVVARLRSAGAVILGRLNLHEFAWGGTTDNPHHGRCMNPWREGLSPGGSSGGSGAAVAAGLCAAAIGTDTLGSVRTPASYCGCVGVKPSNGLVSTRGVFPLSWTLDTVGPIASCVEDALLVLRAIAGPDPRDPSSAMRALSDFSLSESASLDGIRLGVVSMPPSGSAAENPLVTAAVNDAVEKLATLGAAPVELKIPEWPEAARAAVNITLAESASIHEENLARHADDLGRDVRERLAFGANLRGKVVADAFHARTLLRHRFAEIMETVDCLITPTTPTPAHSFDPSIERGVGFFLGPANLLGYPAISVPCGFTPEGLPIGMQIIAAPFAEAIPFRVAHAYECSTDWNKRHPPDFPSVQS